MKGAVFQAVRKIIIKEDLPKPKVKKDDVLIKVKYCGICGTDIESYETGSLIPTGLILGHEFSGEIVEIGEAVKKLKVGDRVTANPNEPCFKCKWCMNNQENMCKKSPSAFGTTSNGALAEYIKVKAERIHLLPPNVSFEEGALVEPLAIAVYAVQESGIKLGENAVIFGAGTIGLSTLQVLQTIASEVYVIEPLEFNQKKALELGATEVLEPKDWTKINKLTKKIGPDHIFDCAGTPKTYIDSLKLIRKGGQITVVGIHVEPFQMEGFVQLLLKNITMRGVYSYNQDTFRTTINLLRKKKVNVTPIITKKIKLNEIPEAFETLSNHNNTEIKILAEIN
ncbi:MAG: zinc-dependent alcohol dehydrogenase [Candidatus Helarchaeota archaeon]